MTATILAAIGGWILGEITALVRRHVEKANTRRLAIHDLLKLRDGTRARLNSAVAMLSVNSPHTVDPSVTRSMLTEVVTRDPPHCAEELKTLRELALHDPLSAHDIRQNLEREHGIWDGILKRDDAKLGMTAIPKLMEEIVELSTHWEVVTTRAILDQARRCGPFTELKIKDYLRKDKDLQEKALTEWVAELQALKA